VKKQQIEEAVRKVLEKEELPLATALKYEVANYEQSISEIKQLHRRNLNALRDILRQRGATDSQSVKDIEERLIQL
jgi:hypothetical protein